MGLKLYNIDSFTKSAIATLVIGDQYFSNWELFAFPSWMRYCEKHKLGLIAITDRVPMEPGAGPDHIMWQKFLIGKYIFNEIGFRGNVCYLDSDFLINPNSPNVFDELDPKSVGLVSLRKRLPYPIDLVLKRLAFFRHTYLSKDYPLDSYLFASVADVFKYHKLDIKTDDFACAGLILFNVDEHAQFFDQVYRKYSTDEQALDGGSDQVHMNYEIQKNCAITWLDYRFQALWIYEMPWKFPFLYEPDYFNDQRLVSSCIASSLYTNYFLHFAGYWEGNMWKTTGILQSNDQFEIQQELWNYYSVKCSGQPQGIIRPKS